MSETLEDVAIKCVWCGEVLTPEEVECPDHDKRGGVICSECWWEENMDYCARCENAVLQSDLLAEPGSLIGVWREAPGLSGPVECGYYRVKEWPIYADGMIEAYLYDDALEWFGPLDPAGVKAGRRSHAIAGPMCSNCQGDVATLFAATPAAPQGAGRED